MCTCLCIHTHVLMYVCMCICIGTCTHTYVCACIHICVHVCIVMSLNKKSFTVEMWVQPSSYGTLFRQGHENNQIKFGIQSDGKLFAQYEISGD